MRQLGVQGENLPSKKNMVVSASDFLIGGLIGRFERSYARAFVVQNMKQFQEIFGINSNSAWYGYDSVNLFFSNVVGSNAKLYVKAHLGNTGSVIDAVQASATINDTDISPEATLKFGAAYQGEVEYGVHGNRIGYTITNGSRFTTSCNGAPVTSDAFVLLDSVAGIKIGDLLKFTHAPATTVYQKVTGVDESTGKVFFAIPFGDATFIDGDVCEVCGIRVRVYEKSLTGIEKEVETELGRIWCTLEPEVTDYYIDNVFANHKYMDITSQTHTHTLYAKYPADVSIVTYLASGAAGTTPTTLAHWKFGNETAFDSLPIRILANCETTLDTVHKSLETYCQARWDNPKVLPNCASNQTLAQLVTIGQSYQRSDAVLSVLVAHWVKVADPFATSDTAPAREVPSVGAVMGTWIRTIGTLGIHYIPVKQTSLYGVIGVVGTEFPSDADRTTLAEAGVNCIQYLPGYGYVIRNLFTGSITTEFKFANGLMMREFIKVSGVDSLNSSENQPNSFNRILEDKMAMITFLRRLWDQGSTGTVPRGETFGVSLTLDGSPTRFEDHVEVVADIVNNPSDRVALGERNLDVYYTYPAPAGSMRVRVGIMLK
jgi:hypothetical protein